MLYQLSNGKTIEISYEQFVRLTDNDLLAYAAFNAGNELNDPFSMSVLIYGDATPDEDEEAYYLDEEDLIDLIDIDPEEKLSNDEFFNFDNLET